MNTGLEITYLWHDADVVEVRVSACNGKFGGTTEVYLARCQLTDVAAELKGFPSDHSDSREFILGGFGQSTAGGAAKLRFFCKDLAGHTVVETKIKADYRNSLQLESAVLIAEVEPASIDIFVEELRLLETALSGSANLKF